MSADPSYLAGSPSARKWLAALFAEAVEAADRECQPMRSTDYDGLDMSQYVLGYLLARTGLPEEEQNAIVSHILLGDGAPL